MQIYQNILDQYKISNTKKLILCVAYSENLMGRKWEGKNVGMKDSYPTFVFLTKRSTMWRIESSKIVTWDKKFILRNVMSNTFGIWKKLTSGKLFFIHLKRSAFQRCNGYSILFKHQKGRKNNNNMVTVLNTSRDSSSKPFLYINWTIKMFCW